MYSTGHCCFRSRARRRSQKKGDYHCTSQRDVSTSTPNSTLYYARASISHWPDVCCSHRIAHCDQEDIYRCDLAIAQEKSTASTKYTSSHAMYAHLPPIRTIEHPRRASYYPLSVVSPASRCTFPSILPCTIVHPYGSRRSEPRALKLSVMFYSCLPAAVLHG